MQEKKYIKIKGSAPILQQLVSMGALNIRGMENKALVMTVSSSDADYKT